MDYKVSYIQQWNPKDGTHYTQQVRLSATEEELARRTIHLVPGINYTNLDQFAYIVGRLDIHTDPRILFDRNSVILYEPAKIKKLYIAVDPATMCCVTDPYKSKAQLLLEIHPNLYDIICVTDKEHYFNDLLKLAK